MKKIWEVADIQSMAAALYDSGWRAEEKEDLAAEYDLSEAEAVAICEILAEYDA